MSHTFFLPAVNIMGRDCLGEAVGAIAKLGFRRALLVTDAGMVKAEVAATVAWMLSGQGIDTVVYDGAKANPTIACVERGLDLLKSTQCDFVVAVGGGSPHDCAKGIALCATNGGPIADYEGVDRSRMPQLPLVAINTTAGTASEMSRFCFIIDPVRRVKMTIADRNVTPLMSVNDPALMVTMPQALTATTGMHALAQAIEAYVSTAATPITDACALKAIELIMHHLPQAVADGNHRAARENMAYAQFLAGMAFNSASLGYVHAMAHSLSGLYDLPHGICNAILLPHVQRFNAQVCADRLRDVAKAMGLEVQGCTAEQGAQGAIEAIEQLSERIGIAPGLGQLGVKVEDLPVLAANALKDACGLTNPRRAGQAQIEGVFRAAF
ncbi:iron-containing alcohol dehydrogenase [Pseudomonas abieticivorans]|uniref:iron-containing alcohol dehydrogenase n=1 Tax=Pseudomonas abieticivorans TaxID=2931382 RepID=UPI0020BE41F0|nr:iron-containing alcohol dehydrogenase [Pseudomonas sp. PIA16]